MSRSAIARTSPPIERREQVLLRHDRGDLARPFQH
jgi:hypothetical protein